MVSATAGGQEVDGDVGRAVGPDAAHGSRLPAAESDGMALDVVFLIDTTGSMGDELERIKTSLLAVTDKLRRRSGRTCKLRYGAVAYKDINDDYVTMAHPFTDDTAAFNTAMQALSAGGGGDLPESLNQGLAARGRGDAVAADAAKVVFLVA
jgi:Mg-chelatase subunit ChlD